MTSVVKLARQITGVTTPYPNAPVLDEKYYVYVLCDPRKPGDYQFTLVNGKTAAFSNKPFYVGKGTGSRSESHTQEALKGKGHHGFNIFKIRTIKKILRNGYEVDIKLCKPRFNEAEAYAYEVLLIDAIGRHDLKTGPLTNMSVGGEGAVGLSPKSRRKAARSYKRWWANLSEAELHSFKEGKREDTKSFFASLSDEEYTAYMERSNSKRTATLAAKTEQEKQETSVKQSAAHLARHALRTKKERKAVAAKTQATISKKSAEEKALTTERRRVAAKAWYENLTDEQRQSMKAKQDAAKANMPLRTCPHCGKEGKGGNMTRSHFDNCKHKLSLTGVDNENRSNRR